MTETPTYYYAGIDVAKARLDMVLRPPGEARPSMRQPSSHLSGPSPAPSGCRRRSRETRGASCSRAKICSAAVASHPRGPRNAPYGLGDEHRRRVRRRRREASFCETCRLRRREGLHGGEVRPPAPGRWRSARCVRRQRITGQSHEAKPARCGPKATRYGRQCRVATRVGLISL
jgi:hypothetical protein